MLNNLNQDWMCGMHRYTTACRTFQLRRAQVLVEACSFEEVPPHMSTQWAG